MRILGIVVCIVAALFFVVAGSVATTAKDQSVDNQALQEKVVHLTNKSIGGQSYIYIDNRSDEQFDIWRHTFNGLAVGFAVAALVFVLYDKHDTTKQAEKAITTPEPTST